MRKVGFDVHGTINSFPEVFRTLGTLLVTAGVEVHIITGSPSGDIIDKELEEVGMVKGINYTHFFSIVDYQEKINHSVSWDDNGQAWVEIGAWNRTKGDYCRDNQIDVMFDDSDEYHAYFDLTKTMYCQIK